MPELTLQNIELLLDNKLEPINTKLAAMEETLASHTETLNNHTTALDSIAKDVKSWNTEMAMMRARLDRHDLWFKQVADKLNLKLETS
ncbi:MAG: hypothetical protein M1383_00150 [Patescibacteria group bacterium]|nr:hypothetical protein [Patescibacteria group bacterium]